MNAVRLTILIVLLFVISNGLFNHKCYARTQVSLSKDWVFFPDDIKNSEQIDFNDA